MRTHKTWLLVVSGAVSLAIGAATSAVGQQSSAVEKKTLTLDGAQRVIAAAEAEARRDGTNTAAIAIVDDGGNLVAVVRLDNTFAAGARISIGKARTAALFKKPTKFFEDVVKNGRTAMVALDDFTPLQGGVPITIDGQIVGAVGVSGAASAQRDEEVAMAGAHAIDAGAVVQAGAPVGPPVSYWSPDDVRAGFAKGAVLFDGEAGKRNYMVHASRRDGAGMAEVHELDADVIYVLSGTATLVTGGSVISGKTTAPNEIRGSRIDGGETRQLAPGAVMIVPRGVPHWFKEVRAPFTYYVVKVR
jgi:glc operon protein GlcG